MRKGEIREDGRAREGGREGEEWRCDSTVC